MKFLASPVLSYAVWLLAIVTVIVLWIAAMLDIRSHVSKEVFTPTQLTSMAAAISIMAVVTVATVNAAFPAASWTGIALSEAYSETLARPECQGTAGTYVFSFGLAQPSYASAECPARPTKSSAM